MRLTHLFASVAFIGGMLACTGAFAQTARWGDQGNGTYINPVLNGDYSDPDAIRVGDKYYMVASDFHFIGMQVLESDDLVNWRYVTQIYDRFDYPGWDDNSMYARGSWAPSIRYHDGRFYVFFCTPSEGLFMSSAPAAEGPWEKLTLVHEGTGRGWEDPCPFWDEDGNAYLGRSQVGAGPIIIHRMSPDGKKLLDEGKTVYEGPVAEGTKIHKMNGYYYLSIPEGGVEKGNQVILRSASIYGPYDKKVVLETGSTDINGPHQGALVDTPEGDWYFLHFQHTPVLGRVMHLQPVHWSDGWPVIGVDIDRNGIGEPVYCWKMPSSTGALGAKAPFKPATSDDFSSSKLGVQWQFNHNPVNSAWSLTEKPGKLSMHALRSESFLKAHNTLTQKFLGETGEISVMLDASSMAEGQKAGLALMGKGNRLLGIKIVDGKKILFIEEADGSSAFEESYKGKTVKLRVTYDFTKECCQFSYSVDGRSYKEIGGTFLTLYTNWKGARPALFSYNTIKDGGVAVFDDFYYTFE